MDQVPQIKNYKFINEFQYPFLKEDPKISESKEMFLRNPIEYQNSLQLVYKICKHYKAMLFEINPDKKQITMYTTPLPYNQTLTKISNNKLIWQLPIRNIRNSLSDVNISFATHFYKKYFQSQIHYQKKWEDQTVLFGLRHKFHKLIDSSTFQNENTSFLTYFWSKFLKGSFNLKNRYTYHKDNCKDQKKQKIYNCSDLIEIGIHHKHFTFPYKILTSMKLGCDLSNGSYFYKIMAQYIAFVGRMKRTKTFFSLKVGHMHGKNIMKNDMFHSKFNLERSVLFINPIIEIYYQIQQFVTPYLYLSGILTKLNNRPGMKMEINYGLGLAIIVDNSIAFKYEISLLKANKQFGSEFNSTFKFNM